MTAPPVLVCTGPDAAVASAIAEQAAGLLSAREAVVLCTWAPPRLPFRWLTRVV